jgi:site-specific DNA-methyltransferase (adenine-specific)
VTYRIFHVDALTWLAERRPASIHAVVTDPPFSPLEFAPGELAKKRAGHGGVWREPTSLNGSVRAAVPRFTVLTAADQVAYRDFMQKTAVALARVLVPGAHVVLAGSPLLEDVTAAAFRAAGFETRGKIIRLVRTLRGGDRPKGAEAEFPDVSVMPRSGYEPWAVFRKPCEGTVAANLRAHGTGGFRRLSAAQPFEDVIRAPPAPKAERALAPHPTLKPQAFMRQVVRGVLPLGQGIILDPFMGSGSTLAAAAKLGLESIGLEVNADFFALAGSAIPLLAAL